MTTLKKSFCQLLTVLFGAGLLSTGVAFAQDTDDDADVWQVVSSQWEDEKEGKNDWIDDRLVREFYGWPKNSPAPLSRQSTEKWDRFNDGRYELLEYELFPMQIIVRDSTAVVHYLYTTATKDEDGNVEMSSGRYTDILVRTDNGWKFIGWVGGDN